MSFVGLLDDTLVLIDANGLRGREVGKLSPGRPEAVTREGLPYAGEAARGEDTDGREETRAAEKDINGKYKFL